MTIDQPATPPPAEPLDPVSASVGRVVGGAILLVLTGALAIVLLAYYIAHDFLPGGDYLEVFGDGLLYGAIFAFVAAVVGFGIMRRGITRRREATSAAGTLSTAAPEPPDSPDSQQPPPKLNV